MNYTAVYLRTCYRNEQGEAVGMENLIKKETAEYYKTTNLVIYTFSLYRA
jgi:hypothetical protein